MQTTKTNWKVTKQRLVQCCSAAAALSRWLQLMNNAKLVHQLMKDHVTAYADTFDVPAFIPVVSDLLVSKLPHVRNFLIEWIKVSCSS